MSLQLPESSIFRAYDIRGIVDQTLTESGVRLIGQAVASESLEAGVEQLVIGRDGRLSGPRLSAALAEGIRAAGVQVIDLGAVPTPVLYYAAHTLAGGSGIMLTGSHNPPNYNGCKIMVAGTTLAGEEIMALHARIHADRLITAKHQGSYQTRQVLADYLQAVITHNKLVRPMKIVADYGNGIAGCIGPQLFRSLGVETINLFAEVDGHFPNHHPDPSNPENLNDLKKALIEHQAELGLAFDGDGDRLGVVIPGETIDSCEIIWADRVMMLLAEDVLNSQPGETIIFDVKCSGRLAECIRQHGGKPVMWRTGHSLVKRKMRELDAPLAGEMSGHFFFGKPWYGFDDALFAAARLLAIISRQQDTYGLLHSLPTGISTPELHIDTDEGENHEFIMRFQQAASFTNADLNTIDGLRADFTDGWGLIRASNTTPVLVLRFEADNDQSLTRIQNDFGRQIRELAPHFKLPF